MPDCVIHACIRIPNRLVFVMSQYESCAAEIATTLREDYWCSRSLDRNNLSTRIYLKVGGAWIGFVVFELLLRVYDSNVVAAC